MKNKIEVGTPINEVNGDSSNLDTKIEIGKEYEYVDVTEQQQEVDYIFLDEPLKTADEILSQKQEVPIIPQSDLLDIKILAKMQPKLKDLIKFKKSDLDKMDEQSKAFLFYNLFKFIFDNYYSQYAFLVPDDGSQIDYYTLLCLIDANFAKRLQYFTHQYMIYVWQQKELNKKGKSKLSAKELKENEREVKLLKRYVDSPKMLEELVSGNVRADVDKKQIAMIDAKNNETQALREQIKKELEQEIIQSALELYGVPLISSETLNDTLTRFPMVLDNTATYTTQDNQTISFTPAFGKGNESRQYQYKDFDEKKYSDAIKDFNPESFYNLSKEQIVENLRTVVESYCAEKGVPVPKLELCQFEKPANSKPGENRKVMGCNNQSNNTIYINQDLIDGVEKFKETGDPVLPARLLQTALHEAQHSVQYALEHSTPRTQQEAELVKQIRAERATTSPFKSFSEYNNSAEERDARIAALNEADRLIGNGLLDASMQEQFNKFKAIESSLTVIEKLQKQA